MHTIRFYIFLAWASSLLALSFSAMAQQTTTINGQVTDALTGEPMPYVNLQLENTPWGTTSDVNGNYFLEITASTDNFRLKVSYLGYTTQFFPITAGNNHTLDIALSETANNLGEVVIKAGKYRNKNNPAVDLIKKVIEHKNQNRNSNLGFYSYEKYEKVGFALNNVTEKMKNNFIFRHVPFIFENADTNRASGKVNLPFFLRETLSDVYYRRTPETKKEYIRGEKNTKLPGGFDDQGLSGLIETMYQDIDIYADAINLATMDFVSPLSSFSPTLYRFYILDTTKIGTVSAAHIYFAPRNKADLGFMGHMWVALDSTYAVRKIDYGIPKDINLNWVNEMQMIQEFDWVEMPNPADNTQPIRGLMPVRDEIFMDFGATKSDNNKSIIGYKRSTYKNTSFNTALPDSLFKTNAKVLREDAASHRDESFWQIHRHDSLSRQEIGIKQSIDSLNQYKPFTRLVKSLKFLFEGYTRVGPIDIGPVNTFYSFNPIEGFRPRFGGRTNRSFSQKIMLEGYAAYGFKDKKWKGYGGFRLNLGKKESFLRFPLNQLKGWYQDEAQIPGQDLQFVSEDNFFLSFKRGVNNKMLYNQTIGLEYTKESLSGFSYAFSAKYINKRPAGALLFDYDLNGETLYKANIRTNELGFYARYAPNEQYYQGATYRTPIRSKSPILEFWWSTHLRNLLGGEYTYHLARIKLDKMFFSAPLGWGIIQLEGGYIHGAVPYPLLIIHRANQTYAYQLESYNLMNFLEFVSSKYASVNYFHNLGGFFFNRVPLLKRFKLREVVTLKGLWGGLNEAQLPSPENGLLRFPVDENGNTLTYTLEKMPYIEASVGVANIFRVLRVDYVRRLTYLDHPNVSKWGIRLRFKVEF